MHPSEEDLASFEPMVAGLLASYNAVEDLYAQTAPQPPAGRTWQQPDPAGNPLGAWYVKTEIQETPQGPLAGRRVAVKDNIEVAGVPMMNGSRTLEGFVPSRDATVVTRLLAAGATDRRQGGVREPVLLRCEPHLGDRAGTQSVGSDQDDGRVLERQAV